MQGATNVVTALEGDWGSCLAKTGKLGEEVLRKMG